MLRVGFMGRTSFMMNTIQLIHESGFPIAFIATAPAAQEYIVNEQDFQETAGRLGVPFYGKEIGSGEISRLSADIILSVNWPRIIGDELISSVPLGILNAHFGDLPKYRGNACPNWAIINDEDYINLSIHRMMAGELDCGYVLAERKIKNDDSLYIKDIYEWGEEAIPEAFLETVKLLSENSKFHIRYADPQSKDAMRCYPRNIEDGRINWTHSSTEILRLIRASGEPFYGAFCHYNDEEIIITRAKLYDDKENYCAMPGQISLVDERGVVVITGKDKLLITEIKHNGEKKHPSSVIRGIRKRLT
ncbi:methionyl-tRNA formyltransferase [Limisalsivibrio acetivorans]|uniref:methionyl-tRNA formyltransferase n=1 Tax=Limisalsivibrio acetivorans TaxID=1304888 RepID=UPI0003B333C7|nr:formyltransferase family protein [Limisalsivibrio acetivorans]